MSYHTPGYPTGCTVTRLIPQYRQLTLLRVKATTLIPILPFRSAGQHILWGMSPISDTFSLMALIPAYNEAETVEDTVTSVLDVLKPQQVVVVDDGSSDGTGQRAEAAGATVLRLPHNLGVGGALRTGYKFAQRHGYSRLIQLDADGQHCAAAGHELLAGLDHADLVIGSRFASQADYQTSVIRRVGMRSIARTVSRSIGQDLTDVTSGFRALGPRAIRVFAQTFPVTYLGDTVMSTVIAHHAGLSICEKHTDMLPRQGGAASQSPFKAAVLLAQARLALAAGTGRYMGRSLAASLSEAPSSRS